MLYINNLHYEREIKLLFSKRFILIINNYNKICFYLFISLKLECKLMTFTKSNQS